MKHKIKVVMLPTEDKSNIHIMRGGDDWGLEYREGILPQKDIKPQHIYITVSQDVEPIKEGDWCIHNKTIFQVKSIERNRLVYPEGSRKVIATTDPKLVQKKIVIGRDEIGNIYNSVFVPQVQQSFLEEYVANPDGGWEVEYERKYFRGKNNKGNFENLTNSIKLKLNQDNEVTITSIEKKMYSREEVIAFIESHTEFIDKAIDYDGICNATTAISYPKWEDKDWIKENL